MRAGADAVTTSAIEDYATALIGDVMVEAAETDSGRDVGNILDSQEHPVGEPQ
jgi:hypothetical protein